MLSIVFPFTLLLIDVVSACANFNLSTVCYANAKDPLWRAYGTKTSTRYKRFKIVDDYSTSGCQPLMIYLVKRHAIRYPDVKDILAMSKILPKLQQHVISKRGELCYEDVDQLKRWKLLMKPEDDNNVSDTGHEETVSIGYAYARKFKHLLDPIKAHLEIGVTSKIRTSQTADAFLEGVRLAIESTSRDSKSKLQRGWNLVKHTKDFLNFHQICKSIIKKRRRYNKTSVARLKKLKVSDVALQMMHRVRRRLALPTISWKTIDVLYRACSFEYAIYDKSPWCAAFGEPELKVLEFLEDIEDYIDDAYGNPINAQMSCALLGDVISKINTTIDDQKPKSYLYFTHAGALKRLWAGLGLFRDDSLLLSTNPNEAFCSSANRVWNLSKSTPFGANLAMVLYRCGLDHFKIATLVNGVPQNVTGCSSLFCDAFQFKKHLQREKTVCDLEQICVP